MKLTFKLAEEAESDLVKVWFDVFSISKSAELADKFIDEFYPAFQKLSNHPFIGESRDDLYDGLRKWTHKKYLIYYTIHFEFIRIERIIWGKQNQSAVFSH